MVVAIIPCLDEETAIGQVVTAVLAQDVSEVVVVDGGSKDRTAERAKAAGARVIVEPRRGYDCAIQAGIAMRPTATPSTCPTSGARRNEPPQLERQANKRRRDGPGCLVGRQLQIRSAVLP